MYRHLLIAVFSLLLIGALLACGGASNAGTITSSSSTGSTLSTTAPSAPLAHFKVGQHLHVGDTWQMVVMSAKVSAGSQYFKPKPGNAYLIIVVSMKNISSQEQDVSSLLQFSLSDQDGQKYTSAIDPDAGSTLDGKVEAGSPLKGSLVYEVPKTLHRYTLSFENTIAEEGQVLWDLTV